MKFNCLGCGYVTEDENDFLAHLIECPSEPENRWETYTGMADLQGVDPGFRNSEILEEEK